MEAEDKYAHETEVEQAGRAMLWLGWLWNAKAVLMATFGFAAVTALAVLDFNLAWNLGVWRTVLTGSVVFALFGAWHFRRTPKKLAVYSLVSWVLFLAFDLAVLFSGMLHEPHIPLAEGYVVANALASVLEADHKNGRAPANVEEFKNRHGESAVEIFDGKYYGPESYEWTLAFTADGKFNGIIRISGDRNRNLPDCSVTRNEKGRLAAKQGDARKYLPVIHRGDAQSSWFSLTGRDSDSGAE
jgi:hypothetical protein